MYYISAEKLRRNITEGRPGTRLDLRLSVVDAQTCKPIKGAIVDIWHADAVGVYSGFGSGASSRTFMRGVQRRRTRGRQSTLTRRRKGIGSQLDHDEQSTLAPENVANCTFFPARPPGRG